jgi:hypothetical protein
LGALRGKQRSRVSQATPLRLSLKIYSKINEITQVFNYHNEMLFILGGFEFLKQLFGAGMRRSVRFGIRVA